MACSVQSTGLFRGLLTVRACGPGTKHADSQPEPGRSVRHRIGRWWRACCARSRRTSVVRPIRYSETSRHGPSHHSPTRRPTRRRATTNRARTAPGPPALRDTRDDPFDHLHATDTETSRRTAGPGTGRYAMTSPAPRCGCSPPSSSWPRSRPTRTRAPVYVIYVSASGQDAPSSRPTRRVGVRLNCGCADQRSH